MSTPSDPGPVEPVTLDELSDYLAGVELSRIEEDRLLDRVAHDSSAPGKVAKLRGIDARVRAALGTDRVDRPNAEIPSSMDEHRATRIHERLDDLARRRPAHQVDVPADESRPNDGPSSRSS